MFTLIRSRMGQLLLALLLGLGLGATAYYKLSHPKIIVETHTVHDTKEVVVDRPVIDERVVKQVVKDPKQQQLINRLIEENNGLKSKVTGVTTTVAENTSTGGGTPIPEANAAYSFQDFQLKAEYSASSFSYKLDQTFNIVTTTATDDKDNPIGLIRVYQVTPDGPKEVASQSTVIFTSQHEMRWFVSPRIQGGFGVGPDLKGGFIGFQWLKKGRSTDPRDIVWAVGTPTLYLSTEGRGVGVLPISFNIGSLKYSPFTNIWISPYLGFDKKAALVVTATF